MRLFGISFLFLLFFSGLLCAQAVDKGKSREEPVKIVSRRVVYEHENKMIEFIDHVHLTKGNLEVWCDSLKVFIRSSTKEKKQENSFSGRENIEKIIALGNVKIKMEDKFGTCEKATYLSKDDLFILEGDAVLSQGKNMVKGDIIKIYMSQNRTEVVGKRSQVEVIFYPKEKKNTEK